MTPNTKAEKARQTIRNLIAAGWTDEALLVDAAAEAIGGDETAQIIAGMVCASILKSRGRTDG